MYHKSYEGSNYNSRYTPQLRDVGRSGERVPERVLWAGSRGAGGVENSRCTGNPRDRPRPIPKPGQSLNPKPQRPIPKP